MSLGISSDFEFYDKMRIRYVGRQQAENKDLLTSNLNRFMK